MSPMEKKTLFVGFFLVAVLAVAVVADIKGYKDGYQAGLTKARVDSWDRELLWRKAVTTLERDMTGSPARISVVFLEPSATTFGDVPGNVAIGVFRDGGKNRFARYTIQDNNVRVERYADEWGKRLLGVPVTIY